MEKQIIFYNLDQDMVVVLAVNFEKTPRIIDFEKVTELGVKGIDQNKLESLITPDTFAISLSDDSSPVSMTYSEWEILRNRQANQHIQSQINDLALGNEEKQRIRKIFNDITEGMNQKYLGKKSWVSIYEELLENLK